MLRNSASGPEIGLPGRISAESFGLVTHRRLYTGKIKPIYESVTFERSCSVNSVGWRP